MSHTHITAPTQDVQAELFVHHVSRCLDRERPFSQLIQHSNARVHIEAKPLFIDAGGIQ